MAVLSALLLAPVPALSDPAHTPVLNAYGRLPLRFEANHGQADPGVRFLARGRGYGLFLTSTEAVLALTSPDAPRRARKGAPRAAPSVVRMRLLGAAPDVAVVGVEPLRGSSHYLVGGDPLRWRRDVPAYARVEYRSVYQGVDLVYYGNQRQLEYDFVVRPGADPGVITLAFDGAQAVVVDAAGDLVISTATGPLTLRKPIIYQETASGKSPVDGGYVLEGRRVRFRVAAYDTSRPLVIDPVLVYSTYLGGLADDEAFGIAVDALGSTYVTGTTISSNFPVSSGPLQNTKSLGNDAFVVRIDPTGANLLYATYLGGSGDDAGNAIAVDGAGNAYIAGSTASIDFPVVGAPPQTSRGAVNDGFLTKLDPAGASVVYSMFLGGSLDDFAFGVAVDASDNAYVTGSTASADFPTLNALRPTKSAGTDAFVVKVAPAGSTLVYSTFLGGGGEETGNAIAADAGGNAYVIGTTTSTNFPTATPVQPAKSGASDAFVSKLDPAGTALVFSTYLGGSGVEEGLGLAVGTDESVYVTGATASANFPRIGGPQAAIGGFDDAYVVKYNPAGSAIVYSTFLGGSADDVGNAIAVHSDGTAYVTGSTRSPDFPAVSPIQSTLGGGSDAFAAKLNAAGSGLVYSTFLGGAGDDEAHGIAVDSEGNAYVTGSTNSAAFPTMTPILSAQGGLDGFVTMLADGGVVQFSGPEFTATETAGTATITVQRTGDITSAVAVDFATSDGTATAGADYLATSGTLTFAPGQTTAVFTVTILNDGVGDGDETVNLTLTNPVDGAVLGGRSTAILRLVDDEPAINFSSTSFAAAENAPTAIITVTRSGSTVGQVTVDFSTSDGTATAGPDYTATTRTLTFAPGVTSQTVLVPLRDDTVVEGTETVNLTLSNVAGGTPAALLGVRSTAVLNITDNDLGGVVQFSAVTYTVAETAPQATITVTRTGGVASGVTVDYQTAAGTATPGSDYVETSGTLTFGAGQTSRTFTVPILNDPAPEGDETVILQLTAAGGGATVGSRDVAVLRIIDDEPTVAFSTDAFTVAEGAGNVTITVNRINGAQGEVSVNYAASN
ncbi:MAG: Calx-beta domain-containing protein, partial [Nocardioidaceae bacterium]